MRRRIASMVTIPLAGLLSLSAWAQAGGPNAALPSGAAITHTPGTPGASDTPGALQSGNPHDSAPAGLSPGEIRALKKQARKAAESSAPRSGDSKSSSAPASK